MPEVSAHSTLQISGMHCASCASIIEASLKGAEGVQGISVNAALHRASLTWMPSAERWADIVERLRRAGYDAVLAGPQRAHALRRSERRMLMWRLFVAGFCAMQVMMLATPSYVSAPGNITPDLLRLLNWGQWLLSIPVMVFSARPFLEQAWRSLRSGRISMEVPVALGLLVMLGVSTLATFHPQGPLGQEVIFDSLTMFVTFLLAGRWMEMQMRHRAALEVEALVGQLPRTALRVEADGSVQTVSVEHLQAGDRVRVPAGQSLAADGVVLMGRTSLSESLLTGESLPVVREPGQSVWAGSLNVGSPIDFCVTGVGADTRREQLMGLAERAAMERPALVRLADRWATPFLWGVLLLSALGFVAWQWIDPSRAIWVAVAVLVVTCPCALSLAAPATLAAAAQAMARQGLLLQRLDAVESMARIDTMVFDKTGTLTQDRLAVTAVLEGCGAVPELPAQRQLLADAAGLARWSHHPVARALVEAAQEPMAPPLPATVQAHHSGMSITTWVDVCEVPGQGLQGRDVQGRLWRLGRPKWVRTDGPEAAGEVGPSDAPMASPLESTVAWGCMGVLKAHFHVADRLREDAAPAIHALKADGVSTLLLSGDEGRRVQAVAAELGLAVAGAAFLPLEKLSVISGLQKQGHTVAMVGDGVNDAPSVARAQVSFAMGHGSSATMAHADVVVTSGRLLDLPAARRHAQLTVRLIRQNLIWALLYNVCAIPLALVGMLPPWAAGLGMALSSLLVIANARRAADGFQKPA